LALSVTAPLLLLFDEGLEQVRRRFAALVENSPEYAMEEQIRSSGNFAILNKPPVGFEVGWAHGAVSLSGYRAVFADPPLGKSVTSLSIDFGPHLRAGGRSAPLARELLAVGADLAEKLAANLVVWNPGKLVSKEALFVESVQSYLNGGVFPVLVTVDFDYSSDESELRSTGLMWFSGQEIALAGCGLRGQQLVRRAVRLVHDIATNGAVVMAQKVSDLDDDKLIDLAFEPQSDNLLHCVIRSKLDAKIGAPTLQ
jgi:hypothetical protein